MNCENCNKESDGLTLVSLITGKRGRPPLRNYCGDCLKTLSGGYRIVGEAKVDAGKVNGSPKAERILEGFDSAAIFLLELEPENLFDPADRDGFNFRCKGCHETARRSERVSHYKKHKAAIAA